MVSHVPHFVLTQVETGMDSLASLDELIEHRVVVSVDESELGFCIVSWRCQDAVKTLSRQHGDIVQRHHCHV